MSRALYRVLNPLVVRVLGSPLHPLLSADTLLLHYRGRRSGRAYTTPVSYHGDGDVVHCFAAREHRWWRNLRDGEPVHLTLRGHRHTGLPEIRPDGGPAVERALAAFLEAVPRDAKHARVRLDPSGRPRADDVRNAAAGVVHVILQLQGA